MPKRPINCDNCGACCISQDLMPLLSPVAIKYPELIQISKSPLKTSELPCVWFNRATGKCNHYEDRPPTCRDFEVGGEQCMEYRRIYNVPNM